MLQICCIRHCNLPSPWFRANQSSVALVAVVSGLDYRVPLLTLFGRLLLLVLSGAQESKHHHLDHGTSHLMSALSWKMEIDMNLERNSPYTYTKVFFLL